MLVYQRAFMIIVEDHVSPRGESVAKMERFQGPDPANDNEGLT